MAGPTHGATHGPSHKAIDHRPERKLRPARLVVPLQALTVLVVFGGAGALCGWLWHHVWDSPSGVVSGGVWYTDETGLRENFAGVGWYVAIAGIAGVVLGALSAWLLHRSELVTLLAVVAGSVLAAYLMIRVGYHLSPPDPEPLAKAAADGTKLDGALRVDSWAPRATFPFGALLGLALVYAASSGGHPPDVRAYLPKHSGKAR